jgi:chemotaxis protein histidine kinase CheA
MVEVANLPPDFPSAADRDIPVRKPLPDSGYADISRGAMAKFEAEAAWLRRPLVHPAELARQQEAAAAAQEAAARAQPDCRIALRDRHAEHASAVAEAARAEGLAHQAGELVAELQQRRSEAEAAIAAGEKEATDKLAAAIAAGVGRDSYQLSPRVGQAQTQATELAIKLHVAEQARDRFATDLKTAQGHAARTRWAVELAALRTLVNVASDIAGGIHQAETALEQRRTNLMGLRTLLDLEQRRFRIAGQLTVTGPPVLARPEAVDPDTDWRTVLERLLDDPEAEIGLSSDSAEDAAA